MNKVTPLNPLPGGEPGSAASRPSNLLLACTAEAIGTFLLVLVGTAVATAAVLGKEIAGPAYDSLAVALAFGLILIPIGAYVDAHLGAPAPVNGANALQVLLVEALIAFILVFTVISTATDKRVPPGTAAMAIGFALSAGVLLGGPVSGGAGNPARALGPMIVSGTFPVWFFYAVGPLLGGVVAALAFRLVGMASTPKAEA